MTATLTKPDPVATRAAIVGEEDAVGLCDIIEKAMDSLIETIEHETELIRGGKVLEASELQLKKAGLSDVYVKAILYARKQSAELKRYAPAAADRLQRRHEEFKALLRINMAVLMTAKDVSEDLVKNVSRAVGKGEKPSTYGRAGMNQPQTTSVIPGIAYDRVG